MTKTDRQISEIGRLKQQAGTLARQAQKRLRRTRQTGVIWVSYNAYYPEDRAPTPHKTWPEAVEDIRLRLLNDPLEVGVAVWVGSPPRRKTPKT